MTQEMFGKIEFAALEPFGRGHIPGLYEHLVGRFAEAYVAKVT